MFIKLTGRKNEKILVNTDKIICIEKCGDYCAINLEGVHSTVCIKVKENFSQVLDLLKNVNKT